MPRNTNPFLWTADTNQLTADAANSGRGIRSGTVWTADGSVSGLPSRVDEERVRAQILASPPARNSLAVTVSENVVF